MRAVAAASLPVSDQVRSRYSQPTPMQSLPVRLLRASQGVFLCVDYFLNHVHLSRRICPRSFPCVAFTGLIESLARYDSVTVTLRMTLPDFQPPTLLL